MISPTTPAAIPADRCVGVAGIPGVGGVPDVHAGVLPPAHPAHPAHPAVRSLASLVGLRGLPPELAVPAALPSVVTELLSRPVESFKPAAGHGAGGGAGDAVDGAPVAAPLTHIVSLLDQSSSMSFGLEATLEGFNANVHAVREGAREAGHTLFTDIRFASSVDLRQLAGSLEAMQPLSRENYAPHGGTALFDAIGAAVEGLMAQADIWQPQTAVLVTVFTDGEENSSRRYGAATLRALIERLEATGRWTFALIGPHAGARDLASALAIKEGNVKGYDVSSIQGKVGAFADVAAASTQYMSLRSVGATASNKVF